MALQAGAHAITCISITALAFLDGCRSNNRFRVGEKIIVIRQNSWPMGGEESAEAVGCDAHQDEFELHTDVEKQNAVGRRYPPFELKQLAGGVRAIDNLFLLSYVFCELDPRAGRLEGPSCWMFRYK